MSLLPYRGKCFNCGHDHDEVHDMALFSAMGSLENINVAQREYIERLEAELKRHISTISKGDKSYYEDMLKRSALASKPKDM